MLVKEACGDAHLKVILEVGRLGTYDNVRRASILAIAAGADFIKTSRGKLPQAATLPVTLVMLEAIRDVRRDRPEDRHDAGGIRQAKQAVQYLVQLYETLGPDWLTPDLYRLGASTLLNDVLMQVGKQRTDATKARITSPLTELEKKLRRRSRPLHLGVRLGTGGARHRLHRRALRAVHRRRMGGASLGRVVRDDQPGGGAARGGRAGRGRGCASRCQRGTRGLRQRVV